MDANSPLSAAHVPAAAVTSSSSAKAPPATGTLVGKQVTFIQGSMKTERLKVIDKQSLTIAENHNIDAAKVLQAVIAKCDKPKFSAEGTIDKLANEYISSRNLSKKELKKQAEAELKIVNNELNNIRLLLDLHGWDRSGLDNSTIENALNPQPTAGRDMARYMGSKAAITTAYPTTTTPPPDIGLKGDNARIYQDMHKLSALIDRYMDHIPMSDDKKQQFKAMRDDLIKGNIIKPLSSPDGTVSTIPLDDSVISNTLENFIKSLLADKSPEGKNLAIALNLVNQSLVMKGFSSPGISLAKIESRGTTCFYPTSDKRSSANFELQDNHSIKATYTFLCNIKLDGNTSPSIGTVTTKHSVQVSFSNPDKPQVTNTDFDLQIKFADGVAADQKKQIIDDLKLAGYNPQVL